MLPSRDHGCVRHGVDRAVFCAYVTFSSNTMFYSYRVPQAPRCDPLISAWSNVSCDARCNLSSVLQEHDSADQQTLTICVAKHFGVCSDISPLFFFEQRQTVTAVLGNACLKSSEASRSLKRFGVEDLQEHHINFFFFACSSPDSEGAMAHALWLSGQVRPLCTEGWTSDRCHNVSALLTFCELRLLATCVVGH